MEFKVNKKLPVSIKAQLKGQIRGMINSKLLRPGQSLPSCNDMSAILSVNRNTVAAVYAELSAEGVLTSSRGSGTVVSKTVSLKSVGTLKAVMDEAFSRAKKMGFTNEEITDQFFSLLATQTNTPPKTILMVWCNHMTMAEVGEALESKLGVITKRLLVEEVEQFPERAEEFLAGVDLVVTSINYIESILPFAKTHDVDVAGIILTPVSRVLNEVVRLPMGTTVGFVCVNNIAAKATLKGVHLSDHVTLNTIWAGADDPKRLKEMVSKCDVIFATHHIYDKVLQVSCKGQEVINMDVSITESNIQMIRERLDNVKRAV